MDSVRSPRARRGAVATRSTLALIGLAFATIGCHADATAPALATCDANTQVTIAENTGAGNASAARAISWTPACAVSFVAVADSVNFDAVWGIRTSSPTLSSPQQMYRTPSGAYALGGDHALQSGVSYVVLLGVRYTDPTTGAVGERVVASTTFHP